MSILREARLYATRRPGPAEPEDEYRTEFCLVKLTMATDGDEFKFISLTVLEQA